MKSPICSIIFVVHITGCGGYADSTIGGVSTTGHGESFMKTNLALRIVLAMESGNDSQPICCDYLHTSTNVISSQDLQNVMFP